MRTRESEEERQGGAWRLRASRRKQEVAEASRACATPRLCPSGEGGLVAAAIANGGDGCARGSQGREGKREPEEGERSRGRG